LFRFALRRLIYVPEARRPSPGRPRRPGAGRSDL